MLKEFWRANILWYIVYIEIYWDFVIYIVIYVLSRVFSYKRIGILIWIEIETPMISYLSLTIL